MAKFCLALLSLYHLQQGSFHHPSKMKHRGLDPATSMPQGGVPPD